jgi:hypothetical protein
VKEKAEVRHSIKAQLEQPSEQDHIDQRSGELKFEEKELRGREILYWKKK